MVLEEKGVTYAFQQVRPGSPDSRELHPFARVPVLRHGELVLFETAAIASYVDETFPGLTLQPPDPPSRAQMWKWISIVNGYMDPITTRGVIVERLSALAMGQRPDEAAIRAALPVVDRQLSVLEAELAGRTFLSGGTVTLADLFVYPIIYYIGCLPEARSLLGGREAIGHWRARIERRPCVAATAPQPPKMGSTPRRAPIR
jgi:glutathione S-transferase